MMSAQEPRVEGAYLERNDGLGAGKDSALLSSHHGLMGECTQIYCFLLAPPAANTFSACAHKCELCSDQLHHTSCKIYKEPL